METYEPIDAAVQTAIPAAAEKEPLAHGSVPVPIEYVPAAAATQLDAPVEAEYAPLAQAVAALLPATCT
jgi:hypothetical protein